MASSEEDSEGSSVDSEVPSDDGEDCCNEQQPGAELLEFAQSEQGQLNQYESRVDMHYVMVSMWVIASSVINVTSSVMNVASSMYMLV